MCAMRPASDRLAQHPNTTGARVIAGAVLEQIRRVNAQQAARMTPTAVPVVSTAPQR
jgi:hypothetical protein